MTSVLPEIERDLDGQLALWLLKQPPSVSIALASTDTGAVAFDSRDRVIRHISASLPREVSELQHGRALAAAHDSLDVPGEWVAEDPTGCGAPEPFDRLTVVEYRLAGGRR
jgi:hypothetical protein